MERREDPKLGPYPLQVPPPSLNGSSVEHSSSLDHIRRALPGLGVALALGLSAIPRVALLQPDEFAQWWRILVAVAASGLVAGAFQRASVVAGAASGAAVSVVALLLAYGLVREQEAASVGAATIAADLGLLAAWGIVAGGAAGAAAGYARIRLAKRAKPRLDPTVR